jgi:hypothetical protein
VSFNSAQSFFSTVDRAIDISVTLEENNLFKTRKYASKAWVILFINHNHKVLDRTFMTWQLTIWRGSSNLLVDMYLMVSIGRASVETMPLSVFGAFGMIPHI